MIETMNSATAPAQEVVEHNTRISAAALSARLHAVEAELDALLPVVVKALQHYQAVQDDHADGIVLTFEALMRVVGDLPPMQRERLLRGQSWG